MISPSTVERVRAETDIVDLIGSRVVLKKVGRNYRAPCPFHQDRNPSFYVSPERQTYHCFGCGVGGNAIGFVMAFEHLEFPEAVRFLARRLGIEIEEKSASRHQGLYDAVEWAARFFAFQLARSDQARSYLDRRGVSPDTVRRFRLGYAPRGNLLRGEVRRRSLPEEKMVQAGLLVRRDGGLTDYFYDRLVFPILSTGGKAIGFTGRVLDDREPKYLNTSDTPIFRKGQALYGWFQAKGYLREQTPILVEGTFDLLALAGAGFNSVVAPLGTALTKEQSQLIRRQSERVLLCFDGDEAGHRAARRALETLLEAGCLPQVIPLPTGSDPDDYVRREGVDALLELSRRPLGVVEFVMRGRELRGVADERAAVRELTALLRKVGDETTRELYVNDLTRRFGLDKKAVMAAIASGTKGSSPRAVYRPPERGSPALEEKLVAAAVQDTALARIVRDYSIAEALTDERLRLVTRLMTDHCDEPGYGPARLLDVVQDEEARHLIAAWTFADEPGLTPDEFRVWAKRLRATWLHQRIVAACREGKTEEAERLSEERGVLLREAVRGKE